VSALKDLWQQQRQQRQQELAQRQQQVQDMLTSLGQERQAQAAQLREDLNLFQISLQQNTHRYLDQLSHKRQVEAQQLVQQLQAFVQTLRLQTSDLLQQHTSERSQRAAQLFQDLNQFHANLMTLVKALRLSFRGQLQLLQEEVKTLQDDTQMYLGVCQQQRQQLRRQLLTDLMQYAQDLRDQVDMQLAELADLRQQRAQQLQQTFTDQRIERSAEMLAFFHNLSEFRAELHQYCVDLHHMVWGDGDGSTPAAPATSSTSGSRNGHSPMAAQRTVSAPAAPAPVSPAPAVAKPTAADPVVVPAPQPAAAPDPQPVAEPTPVPAVTSNTAASGLNPAVITPAIAPKKDPTQVEQAIYTHIKSASGARLGELETILGLNRFQAVDALRSLIKQGKVTQRDRVYVIQEEFSS